MDKNLIPNENKAQVEEVREMESEVLSYQEFAKNYEENEQIRESYEVEEEAKREMFSCGPGNEQGKEIVKTVGALTLASSYFTPAGGITAPMTLIMGGIGVEMELYGHANGDEGAKEAGKFFREMAMDAGAEGISAGKLRANVPKLVKVFKKVCEVYDKVGSYKLPTDLGAPYNPLPPIDLPSPQQRIAFFNFAKDVLEKTLL